MLSSSSNSSPKNQQSPIRYNNCQMLTGSFWSTQKLIWGINKDEKRGSYLSNTTNYDIEEYFTGNAKFIKELLNSATL